MKNAVTLTKDLDSKTVPLKRLVPGLVVGPASWLGPYAVCSSLYLPALIQELDSAHKVSLVALFSTTSMIAASISNMVAGSLSDRTVSRFGKRTPWIFGGALSFMILMIIAGMSTSIPLLLTTWILGQVALNFVVAPMVAWLDLAPEGGGGTASSAYGGLGMALGNNGFTVLGVYFLHRLQLGFTVFGIITFIGCLLALLIVREPSNLDDFPDHKQEIEKESFGEVVKSVCPKWSIGRDYYLALAGKMFQSASNYMIASYILYILTDFMNQSDTVVKSTVQQLNIIMLIFGILCGFFVGPLCDKTKFLKIPLALATIFMGLGALAIYFFQDATGILVYAFLAGLGLGVWNSLNNLLNLKIIPDKEKVAFFLGVYNLGSTVTQALAPILAAIAINTFGFQAIFLMSAIFALLSGISIISIRGIKY
ncbi:MFS transporter [Streptococcaceae bacterium ESL0687]|nr:MFS transporter [Streptococcaceae bacterium ESL0687]